MCASSCSAARARFVLLLHASQRASLARTVEIVATRTCASSCSAARARFVLLLHASQRANLARTVEIVATRTCASSCLAARARFALLLTPHLVLLLVRVALPRALGARSSHAGEGALASHCTTAVTLFASLEWQDAPSRKACESSSHACIRCVEQLHFLTTHAQGASRIP